MLKEDKYLIVALIAAILIGVYLYYKTDFFKTFLSKVNGSVNDNISNDNINKLHPKLRQPARDFINEAEKQGIKLKVTNSFRTYQEQNELYAQGRTKPGSIVTNAKGGQSNHNFATAFDVVPLINGTPEYKVTYWDKIGLLGKSFGFDWGGDWRGGVWGNTGDRPHFEKTFGYSLAQLRNLYESGNTTDGYINVA